MNWLDVVFALALIASIWSGLRKGMVRIGIGFIATLGGFLVASWMYGTAGAYIQPYVPSRAVANFLGFLAILALVMIAGALLSMLIGRFLKLIKLSWADRFIGGVFGLVRGLLVCVVLIMVLLAFSPTQTTAAVSGSYLAPHVIESSRFLAVVTPHEIREGFRSNYEEVKKIWIEALKKKHPKSKQKEDSEATGEKQFPRA